MFRPLWNRLVNPRSQVPHRRASDPQRHRQPFALSLEALEGRLTPATFLVTNLNDAGLGSLRQALLAANGTPGADHIDFTVAGTIRLTSGVLPALTDRVDIDGTTAPGFAGRPVVEVDFNGFDGLRFIPGSSGSALRSLGLIRAGGNGVTVDGAAGTTIAGNFVGLRMDGMTPAGNGGDGVALRNTRDNIIGHSDPVTGVTYYQTDVKVDGKLVNGWQGIRNSDTSGQYLISATAGDNGVLYDGPITGDRQSGDVYKVKYPGSEATSVYGPDNLPGDDIRLVGTYRFKDAASDPVTIHGFLFEGTVGDLKDAANYRTVDYKHHNGQTAKFNYVHSTMGGLAVGNYDSPEDHGKFNLPLGPGHAFLYDVARDEFLRDIRFPGAVSNTAYGIWYNGGTSYTICGGYSFDAVNNFDDQILPIGQGYLVDYDSATRHFSNWTSFEHPGGHNFLTHFEGISSVEQGVYTLSADSVQIGPGDRAQGSWVSVRRNTDGSFGPGAWVDLNYPDSSTHFTSSNSVYGNQVVGLAFGFANGEPDNIAYQATVGFQLSNVISGNGGNGISLDHADDNRIAMNYIGTDVTGTLDRGNARNGILLAASSARNLVGGEATGGNNPTKGVFVRPPQGNLISGNDANGVLITGQAGNNQLSGNFIGTAASGISALGNALDGVAIDHANFNRLIGCTSQQDPFVFYNVVSGNRGNGLRISDSDGTIIHANFFGLGSDNQTPVGNRLNGVVVEGSSAHTRFGGVIPLGNVTAANRLNGVLVRDTASHFTAFNTFSGVGAFVEYTNLGNGQNGMLVTATGGDIVIRTNQISGNGGNGVAIAGAAHGVQVVENVIGLSIAVGSAIPNRGNGVEIGGTAHDIVIGGPEDSSIAPRNVISGNVGYGVAVVGAAHDNTINFTYIGTDPTGRGAIGNHKGGVLLGPGTLRTTVGSAVPQLLTVVSGNHGDGIEMSGTGGNRVIGCIIGADATGLLALANHRDGIRIVNSSANRIGGTGPGEGNVIAYNHGNGVWVKSGQGNAISRNSIFENDGLGIKLSPGANNNQAAPVLASAIPAVGGVLVSGTLTSTPNTTFTVEIYADTRSQPRRSVQGRNFLVTVTVTTDASGFASFARVLQLPAGARALTATATDPLGNTSEFSNALLLPG